MVLKVKSKLGDSGRQTHIKGLSSKQFAGLAFDAFLSRMEVFGRNVGSLQMVCEDIDTNPHRTILAAESDVSSALESSLKRAVTVGNGTGYLLRRGVWIRLNDHRFETNVLAFGVTRSREAEQKWLDLCRGTSTSAGELEVHAKVIEEGGQLRQRSTDKKLVPRKESLLWSLRGASDFRRFGLGLPV